MHPFALPILLLALGLGYRGKPRTAAESAAPPPPKPKPAAKPAPAAKSPKPKPAAKPATKLPVLPMTEEQASQQAAVNAAVAQVVKEVMSPAPAKAQAQDKPPTVVIDVPRREARDAAAYLKEFLTRTHRYGTKKKPVDEVKSAQRDMGQLAVDGIVGPKTRARAAQLGVKLP